MILSMKSYTFVVSGLGLSDNTIEKLYAAAEASSTDEVHIEVICYGSRTSRSSRYLQCISSDTKLKGLKRASVTAGGEWIIYTTAQNIIEQHNATIEDIARHDSEVCVVHAKINLVNRKLGIRTLKQIPYVAIRKSYLISFLSSISSIGDLVKKADKDLHLVLISTASTYPSAIINRLIFVRPYRAIVKHAVRAQIDKFQQRRAQRKAERLSQNVARVNYSDSIPVFIICRDRIEPLKKLVKWLEKEGLKNIFFIDNASTYPPLLEYFDKTPYTVLRLNINAGHTSPWREGIVQLYAAGRPFIVTDPDVIPSPKAHGAVKEFARLLNDHLERTKVGFGLRIDNLPDHYELKQHVISWEKQFWVSEVEPNVYDAEIDTTFALYRPGTPYTLGPGLRTGGKYIAEHEPWYVDSKHVPTEIKYYREHADKVIGSWGVDLSEVTSEYSKNHSHQTTENDS